MSNYDRFRELMSLIEKEMKRLLNISYDTKYSFGELLELGRKESNLIRNVYGDLSMFREIRNLFEHNIDTRKAIIIPDDTVSKLTVIYEKIVNPPKIGSFAKKEPMCFEKGCQIDVVLKEMVKNDFSQVPVMSSGQFYGLLTTNTIARWLGYRLMEDGIVDNENTIEAVMQYEEFKLNYSFMSRNNNLLEVIDEFTKKIDNYPYFDAILITEKGDSKQKLLGIVTKSDLPELYLLIK